METNPKIQEKIVKIFSSISLFGNKLIQQNIYEIIKEKMNDFCQYSNWNLDISFLHLLINLTNGSSLVCKGLAQEKWLCERLVSFLRMNYQDVNYLLIFLISNLIKEIPELFMEFFRLEIFPNLLHIVVYEGTIKEKESISVLICQIIQNIKGNDFPYTGIQKCVEVISFQLLEDNLMILNNCLISLIEMLNSTKKDIYKIVISHLEFMEIPESLERLSHSTYDEIGNMATEVLEILKKEYFYIYPKDLKHQ